VQEDAKLPELTIFLPSAILGSRNDSLLIGIVSVALIVFLLLFTPFFSVVYSDIQANLPFKNSETNPTLSLSGISFPSDYQTLANYALDLINSERAGYGLSPVTQSQILSGQQHADSMLSLNYFSHWDTQGYKPYMRYTLLGGSGYVEENIAYMQSQFFSTAGVESGIRLLETQMLNNDSFCCQNGHRDNILNPYHNRVSIGIAYSTSALYFVEDFETDFTSFPDGITLSNGNNVVMKGNTIEDLNPDSIEIFYEPEPQPLSPQALNTNYSRPYNEGTFIGGVFAPCNVFCSQFTQGKTVYATTWYVKREFNRHCVLFVAIHPRKRNRSVYTVPY
jgi:uncharacterized protein YkwD